MTASEATELLRRRKEDLMARYPLHRLSLFGSVARGDSSPQSDVDVLVEVDPSVGLSFVSLAQEIEEAIGQPTDVVSRRAVPPAILRQIDEEKIDV